MAQRTKNQFESEFSYADRSEDSVIEYAVHEMDRMEDYKRRYLEGKGLA